ncbi:MAG: ribose-5-phosphate isomerase RpiA [Candidatus Thermoplasmatota archaeon]
MNIEKRNAGWRAAEYVEDGMVVGLGTGSTAKYAIEKIGERIQDEGLDIAGIPTSLETEKRAEKAGIELVELDEADKIDLTIDGADEVNPNKRLIKGGGGALLREKIIAYNSKKYIVIVDPSKEVEKLGVDFPLPVEVLSKWQKGVADCVRKLGCEPEVRTNDGEAFLTDNGNNILDCDFDGIPRPEKLSKRLNYIPGVLEHGLFIDVTDLVIIGKENGFEELD